MREVLIVMQCIAITLLVLETGYIFIKWETKLQAYLLAICLSTLVNSVGYFLAIHSQTLGEYLMGLKMSYLGRVWVPYSLLLLVRALCKKKKGTSVMHFLALVHLSIFIIVSKCEFHSLYYKNMYLDTKGIFPCLGKENGIVHEAYNYLVIIYMVYGLTILIVATIKEKNPVQKKCMWLFLSAIVADSAFYIVEITGSTDGFDDTVLGYAISSVFMFFAIFKYSILDTLKLASDYVIDEVSEGIIVVYDTDEIEYYNKPAKGIFPCIEEDAPHILESIRDSISKSEPLMIKDRIYSLKERDLIKNGTVVGSIYVIADDTEQYRYMDQLKEQKEIAEAANASKSAFISVVSHEIRTPMNAVVGMTDLLLRENDQLSDKQEKYLRNIKNSGASLVMIVNDILDQSKIEAGKMEIVEDSYDIRSMTEDVRMIIENRIGDKPIKLNIDIEDSIPQQLVGDSLRIRQILINLMNNAVKFTEEGFINLKINCVENNEDKMLLKFSVKDSGQGIRAEDLSKLGKAFSQVDTKKNHSKEGTGLGLSISSDFISMMGGQLEVASEYGNGSEFYFSIYQGKSNGEGVESEAEFKKQAWQEDVAFTAPDARILVVDDTEVNLMITKELLSIITTNIDVAASGEEAVELVKNSKYDLIFMDYMMPYMDGVEATATIRAMGEADDYYQNIPIVALTGDTSEDTRQKFNEAGINDFTDKPVDIKKLKKKLIKWLPAELIKY